MIDWGIEDEPVPEQTVTITPSRGGNTVWYFPRAPLNDVERLPDPDYGLIPTHRSGWFTAWRIVGWMLMAGALGATIGVWLVLTIYLDS